MIRFESKFRRIYDFVYSQLPETPVKCESSGDWQGCWWWVLFSISLTYQKLKKDLFRFIPHTALGTLMDVAT